MKTDLNNTFLLKVSDKMSIENLEKVKNMMLTQ